MPVILAKLSKILRVSELRRLRRREGINPKTLTNRLKITWISE